MTGGGWFTELEPIHAVWGGSWGRVRFRYRCMATAPLVEKGIERAIEAIKGVRSVRAKGRIRSLAVEFDTELTDVYTLSEQILALVPPEHSPLPCRPRERRRGWGTTLLSSAAVLASFKLSPAILFPLSAVTAAPVMVKAAGDLFTRGLSSHVLEATAVAISLARHDFLAANATAFLLAVGEQLEETIARRSDTLLKDLMHPTDNEIWVERDGVEVLVDSREVETGDTVIVATGKVIPVDGTVLSGVALVNEATMTGESVAVTRRRGDTALSGTLVEEGRIAIYAEQVGSRAAASRIADFVEQALTAKSDTQLQTARLADGLVPMVVGLSGATWLLARDWERVAAVLQADYSCALKLATPVAFKAAMYRAGGSGMLVKGADALERLAAADTFVFDKTGTLSSGLLEVTDSITFDASYTAEDLINLAASVEEHYFHPMAIAVVRASERLAHPQHFNHQEVEFIVAHGVASDIDGKRIVVGSRHFLKDHEGIDTTPHEALFEDLMRQGKTLLYIGFGGQLLGVIALQDTLRENSAATIATLRQLGVQEVIMLTGDHRERAQATATTLGLDDFRAELLPEEKAEVLNELAAQGKKIAFVGDGINDAPALSGAHVGLAMHHGAEFARLAADITLLEDDIERVADAKRLALATERLIHSNFHLTVGLNSTILLAAAAGLLSPVTTSVLHNGSTILTLLRALAGPARSSRTGATVKTPHKVERA
ncbi:heavy metal translocating P-type ATPase [Halorhodospira abdelmalekii]|uniref:heavy metal translocating P-type ATPase n=1 Tax=Halorhodospira abdelmalekii TaxID=421629 RepID=UPI001908B55C|nr:heavy metal translocating P-type ATPase [Halorhodospira abdelmalekii]MBK1735633.1 heavy metal translocating P-type ATPase [Halorhodospira abdelmalekii]